MFTLVLVSNKSQKDDIQSCQSNECVAVNRERLGFTLVWGNTVYTRLPYLFLLLHYDHYILSEHDLIPGLCCLYFQQNNGLKSLTCLNPQCSRLLCWCLLRSPHINACITGSKQEGLDVGVQPVQSVLQSRSILINRK